MKILFIIYDNESFLTYFPMGAGYLVAALRNAGYTVDVYDQNIYHLPEAHLTDHLRRHHYDVVGIGMIAGYHQYRKLRQITAAINRVEDRPFVVLGGHMPSPDPAYFMALTGADAVVVGEAEISLIRLLDTLAASGPLSGVRGIAYRDGDQVILNDREELIADIDGIAFPAWDAFDMPYYTLLRNPEIRRTERSFQIVASRGCAYHCSFCYRMDKGFRIRSPESILAEIEMLQRRYHVRYIEFTDELFACSEKDLVVFCEHLIASGIRIKFYCNGRLNFATPEVLRLMRAAGCVYINYGIESLDDDVLRNINKKLTVEQIIKGIENTVREGIHPGLNVIFGNIGDTAESLQKNVDFLLQYNTYAELRTIRPVTPYPGSPLFYHAVETGLLKGTRDFYENKHVNSDLVAVNFTTLSDDAFNRLLFKANKALITDYFQRLRDNAVEDFRRLYFEGDTSFRGPRQT